MHRLVEAQPPELAAASEHLGAADSLFVNASTWGLMLTGKLVRDSDIEIRQFYTMDDFAEMSTPEIDAQERRLREEIEAQHGKYM